MAPYIYPNNKSLYFSSKGYPGMGGLDFYRVTLGEGNCSTPENLGYPINSNKDELGFVFSVDGSVLFGSKRKGNMDVYSCYLPLGLLPAPVVNRCGGVFDESGKNVNAKVIVVNNSDSTVYKLDEYGEVSLFLDSHFSYTFYILADGFNMYSENVFPIDSSRTCRIYKDVVMKKSVVGDKMTLDNVTFDFDSFVLDDWSNKQLALWVEYMKVNKSLCFEIGGHTDCIGDSIYNMELSIKRAKAIYDYILKKGVSKDRLVYKGYGNSLPVLSNTSEIGRSVNRRTEIIILSR